MFSCSTCIPPSTACLLSCAPCPPPSVGYWEFRTLASSQHLTACEIDTVIANCKIAKPNDETTSSTPTYVSLSTTSTTITTTTTPLTLAASEGFEFRIILITVALAFSVAMLILVYYRFRCCKKLTCVQTSCTDAKKDSTATQTETKTHQEGECAYGIQDSDDDHEQTFLSVTYEAEIEMVDQKYERLKLR